MTFLTLLRSSLLDSGTYWSVAKTPAYVLNRLANMGYRMVYIGQAGRDVFWTMELVDHLMK